MNPKSSQHSWRLDLLVGTLLIGIAAIFFGSGPPIPEYSADPAARMVRVDDPNPPVQDFAYIFNYARYAAGFRGTSLYSTPAHRRFLNEWLGPDVASCACFAYSPTMVLLLAPLLGFSTGVAWFFWNVAGIVVLLVGLVLTNRDDPRRGQVARFGIIGPTTFYALALGQTSLLTTGAAAIAVELERTRRATWLAAVALVVLTIKPPLALLLGAALLAARRLRTLGIASVAVLAIAIGAMAWWGPGIVRDYADLVGNYNLVDAPLLFRAGFKPERMTNLRHVLLATGFFDDSQASRLTWIPLVALMLLPAGLSVVRGSAVPVRIAAAFAATAYALFSPHLSPTEDLVMIAVMCWLWPSSGPRARVLLAVSCVGIQFIGTVRFAVAHVRGEDSASLELISLAAFWAKLVVGVIAARALSHLTPGGSGQLGDPEGTARSTINVSASR